MNASIDGKSSERPTPEVRTFRAEWLPGEIMQSVLSLPNGESRVIAEVRVLDSELFWTDRPDELYQQRGDELRRATDAALLEMGYDKRPALRDIPD